MKKRALAFLMSVCMALSLGAAALASEGDAASDNETPVLGPAAPVEPVADSAAPETPDAFAAPAANPFSDVNSDSPFLPGILYAVANAITTGTTATTFSPYMTCTHAQILTFLWRACGAPSVLIENPFPDMPKEAYYYQAALWAYDKGLIGPEFQPYAPCTRLQAVTYLWKLAGSPASYDAHKDAFPFADLPDNPDALNAVAWASMDQSVTNGTTATTFSPDKKCTRAQIVTFLYRGRDALPTA